MCKLQSLEEKWAFFDISVPYYLNSFVQDQEEHKDAAYVSVLIYKCTCTASCFITMQA